MKRLFALAFAALLSGFAFAAEPYTTIDPPLTAQAKGKIEVIEFFSYGCVHCFNFHHDVMAWAGKLPKDVSFRRVPVSFNRAPMARLSRLFYALDASGELEKLDVAVFKAIHEDRVNFSSDESIIKWVVARGVDEKKFSDAWNGFSIQSQVKRGDMEATAARIPGTPALVVGGRYLINNDAAGSYADLLKLTDQAIAKVRQDGKRK